MRLLAIVLAFAAACNAGAKDGKPAPVATDRATTLAVEIVNRIDGTPATHIAVGGKLRIRIPGGDVTATTTAGPFALITAGFDSFEIKATGTGTGEIEIETRTGYARFTVSAAPIARVGIVFDPRSERRATVTLMDDSGHRLVDSTMRIASGSAPVTFARDAWDRIEFETLPPGDVFVKTDLLGATHAMPQAAREKSRSSSLAHR